ncbi:MAG TPA: RNA pseudouridine synthase [Rheinheimera sp.]|nr:RNA pseudouridine synthase [Rheinheimera sp.]
MKLVLSVRVEQTALAIDILAAKAPAISKSKLKDAMAKGAVALKRGKVTKRLRRAQAEVLVGDELQLHYDDDILSRPALDASLVLDAGDYSIWYKPPGMLSQGNEWSDHLALLRVVEQHFAQKRPVFLVHRLDREASGLVIIAHKQASAAEFSQLIQERKIQKTYHVQVKGVLSDALRLAGVVNEPLDGKPSETRFSVLQQQLQPARTWLSIDLVTGRKHQIRRHFAAIGYPVMGDPMYGKNNQDPAGLALQAVRLSFKLKKSAAMTVELPLQFHRFVPQ